MSLTDLLEERGRLLAQRHGHEIDDLRPWRHQALRACCTRCGASLIVTARPRACGIRGTACSADCCPQQGLHAVSAARAGEARE